MPQSATASAKQKNHNSDEVYALVIEQGSRIGALENDLGEMKGTLSGMAEQLGGISRALARQEGRPSFDWSTTIGTAKDLAYIAVLVVGVMFWVSSSLLDRQSAPRMAVLEYRQNQTEKVIERYVAQKLAQVPKKQN